MIVLKFIIIVYFLIYIIYNRHYMFIRILCNKYIHLAGNNICRYIYYLHTRHSSSQLPLGSSIANDSSRNVSVGNAALLLLSRISSEMGNVRFSLPIFTGHDTNLNETRTSVRILPEYNNTIRI